MTLATGSPTSKTGSVFENCFLVHDTSVALPRLRRSVEGVNGHVAWDHLPASSMARCLLGLYSHDFLLR